MISFENMLRDSFWDYWQFQENGVKKEEKEEEGGGE